MIVSIPEFKIDRPNEKYYKFVNNLFQYYWSIVKNFYKVEDRLVLSSYNNRNIAQIKHARFFSKLFKVPLGLIGVGDSNWENVTPIKFMKELGVYGIAVNIAKGGTRADTWDETFNSCPVLVDLVNLFHIKLFNIGGNNVLQNRMKELKPALQGLKQKFPDSFNQEIPPVYYELVSHLPHFKDARSVETSVKKANNIIVEVFENRSITIYDLFLDPTTISDELLDKPFLIPTKFSTHEDAVHFSDEANFVRIKHCIMSIDFYYHILNNKDWESNFMKILDESNADLEDEGISLLFIHALSLNEPKRFEEMMMDSMEKPKQKNSGRKKRRK